MTIIVFEDEHVPRLYPVTLGRPTYAISCGGFRLLDWLEQLGTSIVGVVRPHLAEIQIQDYPGLSETVEAGTEQLLFVNARVVPSRSSFESLQRIINDNREGFVFHEGELAMAFVQPKGAVPHNQGVAEKRLTVAQMPGVLKRLGVEQLASLEHELQLLQYPHDIVRYNMQILAENLEYRLSIGSYEEVADGVFLGENARLGQYVVTDTSSGPVILESNAVTGPFCYLNGPAHWARCKAD